jgi:hypothetical protein
MGANLYKFSKIGTKIRTKNRAFYIERDSVKHFVLRSVTDTQAPSAFKIASNNTS